MWQHQRVGADILLGGDTVDAAAWNAGTAAAAAAAAPGDEETHAIASLHWVQLYSPFDPLHAAQTARGRWTGELLVGLYVTPERPSLELRSSEVYKRDLRPLTKQQQPPQDSYEVRAGLFRGVGMPAGKFMCVELQWGSYRWLSSRAAPDETGSCEWLSELLLQPPAVAPPVRHQRIERVEELPKVMLYLCVDNR